MLYTQCVMYSWWCRQHTCELDKRGFPYDTQMQTLANGHGGRTLFSLLLDPRLKVGMKRDVKPPYARTEEIGPGYCYPELNFNITRKAAIAHRNDLSTTQPIPGILEAVGRYHPRCASVLTSVFCLSQCIG